MELPYTETNETALDTYRRVHANGEQTHVAIQSVGDSRYVAIAYDIDPVEFQPIDSECIAYDPTLEGVRERARRWMEQHPKGVLGENGDGGGAGRKIVDGVVKLGKKMNDYGNQQVEQIHNQQGGKQ